MICPLKHSITYPFKTLHSDLKYRIEKYIQDSFLTSSKNELYTVFLCGHAKILSDLNFFPR